ncbi:MAG TPA: tetratricopeptide repeat protein [Solirubrobacteraceae bacterium]|nr:tetratricopeptide repeat protein [Solirubrobacteraceae bacterium]
MRDVLSASRYALVALAVAVGFAVVGITGRVWAFIPAVIAAGFSVADALLAWRGSKAAEAGELRALLSGKACRAGQARATEYGVDVAVLPEGQEWHYVHRDFERELREAIRAALSSEGPPLVMLSGETKSGKTRAAFQALRWGELQDAWLVVPRDGARVETLLWPGALPRHWRPLIVWLDDLERYASVDAGGLNEGMFRNLECDRPLAMLATVGGRGTRSRTEELIDPIAQLRDLAACIEVPVKLTPKELARAERAYARSVVSEIERLGVGRRMVAMSELKDRLVRPRERCREGVAVVRAAIDWRRAGVQRPLSADQLDALYRHYLPDHLDPSEELFSVGLKWAREPLPNTQIALLCRAADGNGGYEPYDLAVEVASSAWPAVNERALTQIVSLAEPHDCFQMASTAFDAGKVASALELLALAERSDDRQLSATSAFNTGVLLARTDDLRGAEDAYRRADDRGGLRGAFNLGQLLRKRGDLAGAEEAYRRADQRGSPQGAVNLGVLLERRGELAGAEEAYRRADQRGSRKGASNLARLLAGRDDQSGTQPALARAEERRRVDA